MMLYRLASSVRTAPCAVLPNAVCEADGTCPHWAIEAMGYWKFGVNQVAQRNKSDGTQGPEVTYEEMRMMDGVGSMEFADGSGGEIGEGVLGGMSGGKVETGAMMLGNGTGKFPMLNGTDVGNGTKNDTSPFNGFVVKDDNVFFSS